jgi:anti-sigma B factor antagonist
MDIQITDHKRVSVVAVSGRIDGSTAGEFEAALTGVTDAGNNNIVLDMSDVDFVSSAGLRVLVNARKAVNSGGGKIVLAEPSQQVVETLDIAGLDVLFEQFDDRETAIGTF